METIEEEPQGTIVEPSRVAADRYERMCITLYSYRAGMMGFLDLLNTFEEMLAMRSPQTRLPAKPEKSN
jgi:hypothetical protein